MKGGLRQITASRPLNPVLARELKERMRRKRSAVVITLYLVVLAAVLWLLYLGASATGDIDGPDVLRLASLGRATFQTLLFFMLLLVCFIVPGLSAGGIAGERERQTLIPLQVTLLRPRSILLGKLGASTAFVALLVVAALPIIGVSFLLGGVEVGEVVRGVAMVLVVAATLGCLSLTCSTLMRRVQGATVVSYAMVLFLVAGTFFVFGAQLLADREGPGGKIQAALWLNPLMATADVLSRSESGVDLIPSPFTPLQELIEERTSSSQSFDDTPEAGFAEAPAIDVDGNFAPPEPVPLVADEDADDDAPLLNRTPFWLLSVACYAGLSVGGLALASRRLSTPAEGGASS